MLRQTARKTTTRKAAGRSVGQLAKARRTVRGQTASKKSPFVPRMETFFDNLETFAHQRKMKHGANDRVYKELRTIQTGMRREIRKQNPFNPNMAKTFCRLSSILKETQEAPASLREGLSKLCDYLCNQSQQETVSFLNEWKRQLSSFRTELEHLHQQVYSQVHRMEHSHTQWMIDPAVKRRGSMMMQALGRFRTKWLRSLNTLNLHAHKSIQSQVQHLKENFEELQKSVRKHQTLMARYGKSAHPKPGYKMHPLLTANQIGALENRWKQIHQNVDEKHMQHCQEWSKAAKHF